MIVRPAGQGRLHLITQPDHAALARRIMDHWRALEHEPRRDIILFAIEQHDSGWRELDDAPLLDAATGRLADFVHVVARERQGVWPRGIDRAAREHPWAGALIANHAATVYGRLRADPGWARFFAEMEASRAWLVEQCGLAMEALQSDYVYLRLGDLMSLLFCTGDADASYGGVRIQLDGGRLLVSPDPFGSQAIPLTVKAREVADRHFASEADLRNAVRTASVVELKGTVSGAADSQ